MYIFTKLHKWVRENAAHTTIQTLGKYFTPFLCIVKKNTLFLSFILNANRVFFKEFEWTSYQIRLHSRNYF